MAYNLREQTEDAIGCVQLIGLAGKINILGSLLVFYNQQAFLKY